MRNGSIRSLLLALLLVLALPVGVLAETEEPEWEEQDVGVRSEEQYLADLMAQESDKDSAREEETVTADQEEDVEEAPAATSRRQASTTGDNRQAIINSSGLSPRSPQSQVLDAYLDDLLDEILDDRMDTYQQVKACYDYLVANTRYGSHMARLDTVLADGVSCRQIYKSYGEIEGFGAVALSSHTGLCNAYASAFILMTRKIGLDANLVKGSTKSAGGGYAYHEWAEIRINGVSYVFDPQLEQNLRSAGLAPYTVFGVTHDQIPGRYIKY